MLFGMFNRAATLNRLMPKKLKSEKHTNESVGEILFKEKLLKNMSQNKEMCWID